MAVGVGTRARATGTYLAGLVLVAVAGVLAGVAFDGADRRAIWLATAVAVVVQGPLGWWLVRSLGRPGFIGAWVAGMVARLGVLVLLAFAVLPLLGWPLQTGLVAAAALLVALLGVEIVVAMQAGGLDTGAS